MTADLVQAIYYTLDEYGEEVVSIPDSLKLVIARHCKPSPDELQAIIAAAKSGAVEDLLQRPNADVNEMSGPVAQKTGLPQHTARWALEIWQVALHYFFLGEPPPSASLEELRSWLDEKPRVDPLRLTVTAYILVALAGTIAGMLPGILVAEGYQRQHPQAMRVWQYVERHEPPGTRLTPQQFAGWIGTLGGFGGLVGAALGWLPRGFHNPHGVRILAGIIGAMWAFDGALFGAVGFGMIGALCGSLVVATVVTYLATLLGPFAVLLFLKPLAWFVLPHFT